MIAAFDTSSASGSIALVEDGRLIAELTAGNVGTHANWLMPAFESLLKGASKAAEDIDLFAVAIGPGSFTGLRIGITTVKGLAWSLGKKTAAVSTLASLALNLRYTNMTVCTVLDARKGEVYAALYRFKDGGMEVLMNEAALAPEGLFKVIRDLGVERPIAFLGNGLKTYSRDIKNNVPGAFMAPEPLWHIRASNIAMLATGEMAKELSPVELKPVYLRKSEAELKSKGAT